MDDPVHRSLPCYMQAQQLSKSMTMESKPSLSCIWFCIHLWQYFLNFWPSCKQTASYYVWKFCSSTFTCLVTNIGNSGLCFKILWLSARYIEISQFRNAFLVSSISSKKRRKTSKISFETIGVGKKSNH